MQKLKLKYKDEIVTIKSSYFYPYSYGAAVESKDNVIICDSSIELSGCINLIKSIMPKYYSFAESDYTTKDKNIRAFCILFDSRCEIIDKTFVLSY